MHVIPDTEHHAERRRKWHEFVGQRPRTIEDVRTRFMAQLPRWDWPSRAHDPVPLDQGARPTGLSCYAAVYQQPRTITSSLHDGAEGAAARRRANAQRVDRAESEAAERRDPLTPGDFVFALANWTNEGGFQIPMILLEMPDDFEGKDTTDPDLVIKPKWYCEHAHVFYCSHVLPLLSCVLSHRWHSHNGKYSGKYEKWCDESGLQYVGSEDDPSTCITRGAIAIVHVTFTQKEPHNPGGYWKIKADTKRRLEQHAQSKYEEYK